MGFTSHKQPILIAAGLFGVLLSSAAGAGIKCWTNSEGVRECGNSVPPEYSQKWHEEVSEQGIVIDKRDRALTEEEIAEQERRAAEEAARQREIEAKKRQDAILLQTFSSEGDILTARDDKLAAMDAQIKLTESRIEKLEADLNKRMGQAAAEERAGKQPPKALTEDIESLRRQIQTNKEFIAETRADQERIKAEYQADLERFRELKSGG